MKVTNNNNCYAVVVFFFLFSLSHIGLGQPPYHRGCATPMLDSIARAKNSHYDESRRQFEKNLEQSIRTKRALKPTGEELIYTIPVVVHVVSSTKYPKSDIPEEEILQQIEILNQDFRRMNIDAVNTPTRWKPFVADIKIQFCLATRNPDGNAVDYAINRVKTTNPEYNFELDNVELKNTSYWPSDQYLNIWVARLNSNILGYAQYPDDTELDGLGPNQGAATTDGVVIDYRAFGLDQPAAQDYVDYPYVLGRTLTHEVGHWLGLFHTFGDEKGCSTSSTASNDYITDTPRIGKSNQGLSNCNATIPSCSSLPAMYENYMDYTNDACMNLFTKGQKERMRTAFLTSPRRIALLNSGGCCGAGIDNFSPPYTQTFDSSFPTISWDDTTFASNFKWNISPTDKDNSAFAQSILSDSASILSPFINLTTATESTLEFEALSGSTFIDKSIKIYYELTCSETWVELATVSTFDNNWNTYSYDLSELAGQKYVRFRIEAKTKDGETIYLDNFKIYKSSETLETELYPNPSTGQVFLEVNFSGKHPITVFIYNTIGQLVKSFTTENSNSTLFNFSFDELSVGTYFLKTEVNGDTKVNKLLLAE